jgi:hypothetical protein
MELEIGYLLQKEFQIDLINNVEKDGQIIYVHKLENNNGLKKKKELLLDLGLQMVINGLKLQVIYLEDHKMILKIECIQ